LMDVLQHWSPIIDQAAFRQGPISDEVWRCFKQVVQLCHAFRHWEQDAHNKRLSPPRMYSVPAESKRQFKKRQDEWKEDIRRSENHRNRAQFLADDTVARLSYLGTNARANEAPEDELVRTADWKLWFALRVAVRAHPRACAFEAFDADKELEATGDEIAVRWLRQAGYSI
jgi:hypothetical protein